MKSDSLTIGYVTTRQQDTNLTTMFNSQREREIDFHYGSLEIRNAELKAVTSLESMLPDWFSNLSDKKIDYQLNKASKEQYRHDIENLDGDTLVYIHGYNTSFTSAISSLTVWINSTHFSGNVFLFSWPSQDSLTDYAADKESAVWSAKGLASFLYDLLKNTRHRVHVMAHSMGSVTLTSALLLSRSKLPRQIDNSILAAPDLDAELFTDVLWPEIRTKASRWSIYHSKNDVALQASQKVNTSPRLGVNALDIEGIEFIDVSDFTFDYADMLASHNYHEQNECIIHDIHDLIRGHPPCKRREKRSKRLPPL